MGIFSRYFSETHLTFQIKHEFELDLRPVAILTQLKTEGLLQNDI